jgi:hypothetical protein
MHRHRLHNDVDYYCLPQPPAPAASIHGFIACPAVLFQGSTGCPCWQFFLYQTALAQAQLEARPSLIERDWLGVWN